MHKNVYNPGQFISKSNTEQPQIKKNEKKLSYDEIRNIVEHRNETEIPKKHQEKQIKHKFNIV